MFLFDVNLCREIIFVDSLSFAGDYKDTKFFTNLDISKFIKKRNSMLVIWVFWNQP